MNTHTHHGYDERTLLLVMEAFISANRALLHGIEDALKGEESVDAHYCPGTGCSIHRAALAEPLHEVLGDNTRLRDFISEVLGKTQRVQASADSRVVDSWLILARANAAAKHRLDA